VPERDGFPLSSYYLLLVPGTKRYNLAGLVLCEVDGVGWYVGSYCGCLDIIYMLICGYIYIYIMTWHATSQRAQSAVQLGDSQAIGAVSDRL
jgi:hypothetical protein